MFAEPIAMDLFFLAFLLSLKVSRIFCHIGFSDTLYRIATKQFAKDAKFRHFRRQLFHSSLAKIFESLKVPMSTPEVVRCPDGRFRRAIYGFGPYIADYPEQSMLCNVVNGWCAK